MYETEYMADFNPHKEPEILLGNFIPILIITLTWFFTQVRIAYPYHANARTN